LSFITELLQQKENGLDHIQLSTPFFPQAKE